MDGTENYFGKWKKPNSERKTPCNLSPDLCARTCICVKCAHDLPVYRYVCICMHVCLEVWGWCQEAEKDKCGCSAHFLLSVHDHRVWDDATHIWGWVLLSQLAQSRNFFRESPYVCLWGDWISRQVDNINPANLCIDQGSLEEQDGLEGFRRAPGVRCVCEGEGLTSAKCGHCSDSGRIDAVFARQVAPRHFAFSLDLYILEGVSPT